MSIGYLVVGSIAGSLKDALGYTEVLHDEGYSDIKLYLQMDEKERFLHLPEVIEKLESSIPAKNFVLCSNRDEIVKASSNDDFVIGGSSAWIGYIPNLRFVKTIEQISDDVRKSDITFFAPSDTLARRYKVLFIPRPINFLPFYNKRSRSRRYELTNACVINPNKRLEVLNELSKSFKTKVALIEDYHYQLDILSRCDNLKYDLNCSVSEVARLFGASEVFYQPSKGEKASIALDEALCSGCYPIAYAGNIGSFYEQTKMISYRRPYEHEKTIDLKIKEIEKVLEELKQQPKIHDGIADSSFRAKDRSFVKDKWLEIVEKSF